MSTAVHGAQVVGGMQKTHDKGERAVGWVYGLDHNGDRGGKGAEGQTFSGFTGLVGENGLLRTRA